MLLVIHNLPPNTRYNDVKSLIQTHCALNNVILDNLMSEGVYKKVTVGVANDADAVLIVRKLNGLILAGNKLYVEEMRNNNETSYNSNKTTTRWNQPHVSNNPPSLLSQNTFDLGQNSSMLSHNMDPNMVMGMRQNNSMMGQNSLMMRQNNSMIDQNSGMMGMNSMMGQKGPIAPLMSQNSPAMVPPPLMGYSAPAPFSGPFYMSPQTNDYGTHGNGQQSASQYPDRKDSAPSRFPDTGSRRNVPDKPISVWASNQSNDYSGAGYSGNSGDRYESRQSSNSRRTKWDNPQEHYESVGPRETSKRPKPWATDNPPYKRTAEYESFDRSYDRGQERYSRRHDSRRPDDSGTNLYQRRPHDDFHTGSRHRKVSPPGFRKGPSRYDLRSRDVRSPPPKRFRADHTEPSYKPVPSYSKDKKPVKKLTLQKIVERDVVWRSQAAAEIVKDMFTKLQTNVDVPQNVAFQKMKIAVRNRLLIILNNRLEVKIPDQVMLYRRRFKTDEDQCLYNRVIRHILHDLERNPEPVAKDDADPALPKVKQPAKTIVQLTPAPVEQVMDRLPKYPQGSKAAYKLQKQQYKKELELEGDPATKKAIEDEIEPIKDIILSVSVDPTHEGEAMFCKRITEPAVMEEIKKMLAVNVAKRVLNVDTVPLVRILGVPKPPKKAPLDEFLQTRGVISLKKSDRKPMYIATCGSYESFDKLCALKDVVIDNVKVLFKPMYLTPPLEKVKLYKKKQKGNAQNAEPVQTQEQIADTNTAVKEIKQEIVTPVKNKMMEAVGRQNETEIKKEVSTPVKSKPVTEVKKEVQSVAQNIVSSENNAVNEGTGGNENSDNDIHHAAVEGDDDDDYNEDDYAEYGVEDASEVNEDDLEDY